MKFQTLLFLMVMSAIIAACTCTVRNDRESDAFNVEDIEIDGVRRLKISGIINLNLEQDDSESLMVEGNPGLVKKLKVKQRGDLLELTLKEGDGFLKKNGLKVNFSFIELTEITFEGVGNISSAGLLSMDDLRIKGEGVGNINLELEADEVYAELNFVGNMVLKGMAKQLILNNEGIGNIDASQLIAQKVALRSSGIGAISVHSEEELNMEVNGLGTVTFSGNPTVVNEKVSGIGKVIRK